MPWLALWPITPAVPASTVVGRIVRSEGVVRSLSTGTASAPEHPVTVGDEIRTDTLIDTTAGGRVAVALGDDASLRVDVGSRIVMLRERVVRLEQGAVYVDSRLDQNRPILVQTQNGDVRDIGTQFEVRTDTSTVLIRVREGEVIVDRRGSSISARAGELLRIDRQGYFFASIRVVPGSVFGISPWLSIALNPAFFSQSEYCNNVQHSPSGVCVNV